MTVDKRGDALLSALVGLVRAASKQGKTPETDAVLLRGLCALGAPEAEQRAAAEAAHAEKNRIVPDCARCAMPCGSTADGDMQAAWSARGPVRAEKAALLAAIRTAAPALLGGVQAGTARESALLALHRAVFALCEDWAPAALSEAREALLAAAAE
ncbi:MAG: hypothetical protein ACLTNS_13065 [Acutalibacteraceae bacterium]